jgi:hypothetical protein
MDVEEPLRPVNSLTLKRRSINGSSSNVSPVFTKRSRNTKITLNTARNRTSLNNTGNNGIVKTQIRGRNAPWSNSNLINSRKSVPRKKAVMKRPSLNASEAKYFANIHERSNAPIQMLSEIDKLPISRNSKVKLRDQVYFMYADTAK